MFRCWQYLVGLVLIKKLKNIYKISEHLRFSKVVEGTLPRKHAAEAHAFQLERRLQTPSFHEERG